MRRPLHLVPLAIVAVGGATALVVAPSTAAAPRAAAGPAPMKFSHEVVVDEQRLGFEPGVQVDGKDRIWSSVPQASSRTISNIWLSDNHGNSYRMVPGNVLGTGRNTTCPQGGGDTELALDAKGDLFFSDLQNLSNLSNSVTTDGGKTFTTSCLSVPNTPVDRMWYAVHGTLGEPGFVIYEEYDAVDSAAPPAGPGNQLVEVASTDGVNFQLVRNDHTGVDCLGAGVADCVSDNEGIPGNQVLDKATGDLLIAHTSNDGNQVIVDRGKVVHDATGFHATWTPTVVNASLCPDTAAAAKAGEICGAALFATIAEDTAGHYYVVFASNATRDGTQVGPYAVYMATSMDGVHWAQPVQVSAAGSNAFPWITAGDPGRVAVTYYHATEEKENGSYVYDDLKHGSFTVELSQSLNALSTAPTFRQNTVSEHPIKYGPICTQGTACEVSMGDRSLGDYLQVGHDARGAAVVAYVDDTSNAYAVGPSCRTPQTVQDQTVPCQYADAGPVGMVRQIGGPSLFANPGTVDGPGDGPGAANDQISDPTGDAMYSANGALTPAPAGLDLTHVAVTDPPQLLRTTMKVADLSTIPTPTKAGGPVAEWITRFTTFNGGKTQGNGHIYYLGAQSVGGAAPTCYDGDVAAPPRQNSVVALAFKQDNVLSGSGCVVDQHAGTVTVTAPLSDFPEVTTGTKLYSVTAFTASALAPLGGDPVGLFNQLDATSPVDHVVGAVAAPAPATKPISRPRKPTTSKTSTKPAHVTKPGGSLAATGLPFALPAIALLAVAAGLLLRRRRPQSGAVER